MPVSDLSSKYSLYRRGRTSFEFEDSKERRPSGDSYRYGPRDRLCSSGELVDLFKLRFWHLDADLYSELLRSSNSSAICSIS